MPSSVTNGSVYVTSGKLVFVDNNGQVWSPQNTQSGTGATNRLYVSGTTLLWPSGGVLWPDSGSNDTAGKLYISGQRLFYADNNGDVRVAAAPPAIYVGTPAEDSSSQWNSNRETFINVNGAATANGTLTIVEMYFKSAKSGIKIASFYGGASGPPYNWTTRDYETIGDVSAGWNYFSVSIDIQTGDYIGISGPTNWSSSNGIMSEISLSYNRIDEADGDQIPCTNVTFTGNGISRLCLCGHAYS